LQKNKKKSYEKIGILGGTFDPPHKGHLYISKIALKRLKLNKILWIITKKNPLKKDPFFATKIRIKLSKKLVLKEKKIFINYFDSKVRSNSTYNILNYIKKKNKKKELYFLIGADNLIKLHKWHNWRKIPKLAKIVIFARENYSMSKVHQIASKRLKKNDWIYINSKKINISSSLIRKFW
tara:strand:+ start:1126 stop:1665 length:540 start_codon:yes stop_codon:yes gene_type:complete